MDNTIINFEVLSGKGKSKKEIEKLLRSFNDIMQSKIKEVIIYDGKSAVTRAATIEDRIEFIGEEWVRTLEQLKELGLDIE